MRELHAVKNAFQSKLAQKKLRQQPQQKLLTSSAKPLALKPSKISVEKLQNKVGQGLKRLSVQAERINQLSNELEAAMVELNQNSFVINQDLKNIQTLRGSNTSLNVCECKVDTVPYVEQQPNGSLVLKSRRVILSPVK